MLRQKQAQGSFNPKLASTSQPELKHVLLQMFLSFSFCKKIKSGLLGQPPDLWNEGFILVI